MLLFNAGSVELKWYCGPGWGAFPVSVAPMLPGEPVLLPFPFPLFDDAEGREKCEGKDDDVDETEEGCCWWW
jgi:hypothetical protein